MAFESFLHQNLQRENLSFSFRYMHDLSQADPHGFGSIFDVYVYITFSLSLDHVISKHINAVFFIILPVRGKPSQLGLTCIVAPEWENQTMGLFVEL